MRRDSSVLIGWQGPHSALMLPQVTTLVTYVSPGFLSSYSSILTIFKYTTAITIIHFQNFFILQN